MTRHNMGFLSVQSIAKRNGLVFKEESKFHALVVKGKVEDTCDLLMPTTYMNESGRAVKAYLDYYKLTPADLVVVNDDIASAMALRLRP